MTNTETKTGAHLTETEVADYLGNTLPAARRGEIEQHIADCDECLKTVLAAHEAVTQYSQEFDLKGKGTKMVKKLNVYLILAVISFVLSFVTPRYFIQLLVATLLLGIKWIVDAKSTKMLVMIYEAWKKGGEKEASRILETLEPKNRL